MNGPARAAAALGAAVALLGLPARAADRWERLPDAPVARQEVAAATVGGKLYVVGGYLAPGRPTNRVDVYDPVARTWAPAPPYPTRIHHAMAVGWQGRLVVIGGNTVTGGYSAQVYTLDGGRWRKLPSLRLGRSSGAAAVAGSRIVVAAGRAAGRHVGESEIFDGRAWRLAASIPTPRDHPAGAGDDRLLYVVGGRRPGGAVTNAFEAFDPAANRWRRLAPLPAARFGLGAAVVAGRVVVAGGESDRVWPRVDAYDPAAGSWTRWPYLGVARHGLGVAATGGAVYAAVGATQVEAGASAALEALAVG